MSRQFLSALPLAACALLWASAAAAGGTHAPQVSNEHGVKITATLGNTRADAATWEIAVVMETHARPLGEALESSSVLIAGNRQYLPLGWEGSAPGGHHRSGTLRFKAIAPLPEAVELQIRLAGERSPRRFKWRLN